MLGVPSELQLPAYTSDTATRDPSRICDLHHSSWQGHFFFLFFLLASPEACGGSPGQGSIL